MHISNSFHPASPFWVGPFTYDGVVWPTKQHTLMHTQLKYNMTGYITENNAANWLFNYVGNDPHKVAYMSQVVRDTRPSWKQKRLTLVSEIWTASAFQNCKLARALLHPIINDDFPQQTTFEYNSEVPFDNDPFWQPPGNQLGKILSEVRYVL